MASQPSTQRHQDRAPTYLTQDEMRRLFAVIKDKRDRAIFAVAYRHGLRASEVGMIQCADLDLQSARIIINRQPQASPLTQLHTLAKVCNGLPETRDPRPNRGPLLS